MDTNQKLEMQLADAHTGHVKEVRISLCFYTDALYSALLVNFACIYTSNLHRLCFP